MPLTDAKIKGLRPASTLFRVLDEKGLCIEVPPSGALRWRMRYRFGQREQMLSLGTYPEVSLKQARAQGVA
ncbi:MAG TPA: Arm DNA-binding domain-containing protein, partial [Candidatus Competibacteraceae bacterium]|nr:Arm DNA-binding domain-containing protein [Candidatus Competibacteraceae bacterium]